VYTQFSKPHLFWQNCGEDDIKISKGFGGRMDPVLKLYLGCRVMLPTNVDVHNGQANGTQAIVKNIVLKPNNSTRITYIANETPIPSIFASQIDHIQLQHINPRIDSPCFNIRPKTHTFKTKIQLQTTTMTEAKLFENIEMKATQLPLLLNNATTGHKLQGSGVEQLFVHTWSYVTNWPYVMLSRVKTMQGLYARKLLSEDLSKYAVPTRLTELIHSLQQFSPYYFTLEEYKCIMSSSPTELFHYF
jgi:hypothetical protein